MPGNGRVRGTVKWFSDEKGYGFVTPDDGSKDCFVHYSALPKLPNGGKRNLTEGAKVEFDQVVGTKGPAAENVTVVG